MNSVVKLKLSFSQQKTIFIVVQLFEVCYYDCPLIGNPIDYQPGFENPNQNNMIPQEIIEKGPQFRQSMGRRSQTVPMQLEEDDNYFQNISDIDPYMNSFCIKGRITKKSKIRSFGKEGKVFSIVIFDGQTSI